VWEWSELQTVRAVRKTVHLPAWGWEACRNTSWSAGPSQMFVDHTHWGTASVVLWNVQHPTCFRSHSWWGFHYAVSQNLYVFYLSNSHLVMSKNLRHMLNSSFRSLKPLLATATFIPTLPIHLLESLRLWWTCLVIIAWELRIRFQRTAVYIQFFVHLRSFQSVSCSTEFNTHVSSNILALFNGLLFLINSFRKEPTNAYSNNNNNDNA
jgi:hypothetical protein